MELIGKWSYSAEYDPPAPVIKAELVAPARKKVEILAFIDSGADLTVISEKVAKESDLTESPPLSVVFIESPDYFGLAPLYHAEIAIKDLKLQSIVCVAPIVEQAIFGRNLLNEFVTTLNGPSKFISIYTSAPNQRNNI